MYRGNMYVAGAVFRDTVHNP